jgi:predicted metal-dependent HD superfamily phosphohydrolase
VLRGFAQRPRLYLTDFAAAQWEPQARNNLDREIARLDGPDIDGA